MTLKQLLTVLDCDNITICYAGFGERIYKGPLKEIPTSVLEHYSNFYVTLLIPNNIQSIYIEIHENKGFASVE